MKLTTFAVLFAVTLMVSGTIFGSVSIQEVEAVKGKGVSTQKYGVSTGICGDRLCSEIPGGREAWEQQQAGVSPVIPDYGLEAKNIAPGKDYSIKPGEYKTNSCNCSEDGTCTCGAGCNCSGPSMKHEDSGKICTSCGGHSGDMSGMKDSSMKTESGTIQSKVDPGLGHEQHQLAVILPPSDKMYHGLLTYSASENVQLVALQGPLTEDEVMGQSIWTPDGKTKFALTVVDQKNKMGTWMFTGNAIAVHSFNTDPFAVTYTIHHATVSDGHAMKGTCQCAPDCNCTEDGVCTCSGEEGPCMCGPNCTCGDAMKHDSHEMNSCNCSEDGTCTCGAGCNCSGPSMKHDSYGETCTSCGTKSGDMHGMSDHAMNAMSGTIQSKVDPGLGHEQHQLAVLLAPRDNAYTGFLTYSASENVQLVALQGPLTEDEVMGQSIWTPDGKTKFALTVVDQKNKMGTWMFTGNAIAVHSFNTDPFAVTYSIVTMDGGGGMSVHEKRTLGATCNCASDCTCNEDGVCTCSGEKGPCMCGPNCNCGQ